MNNIFLILALLVAALSALLYFAGERRLLNFVDADSPGARKRLNRYAAMRLLLPVVVNLGCAWLAAARPALTVPLISLTPLSILCAVVWIGAGAKRFGQAHRSS